MTLSEFLKRHLKDNNMSVRELAGRIGISDVMLHYILKRKHPAGVKSKRRIATYFELDIREVVRMNDSDKQS